MKAAAQDARGSWLLRPGVQLAKYGEVVKITVMSQLAYWANELARALFMLVVIFVFAQLWRTTYTSLQVNDIDGFAFPQILWYLVLGETIYMGLPRISALVDSEVKSGQLAYTLNRPYSYALYHYGLYLGKLALALPINFCLGGVVAYLQVGLPPFAWGNLLAALPALLLGLTLHFLIAFCIGLLAFWFEDTASFYLLYSRVMMILGGMLLPLDLFPQGLRQVAAVLPISLIIYAPAKLAVGAGSEALSAGRVLLAQGVWIALVGTVTAIIYSRGVRRVNVHGG